MTTLETLLKQVEELDMKGPLTMDDYADFRTAAPILVEVIRKLVEQRELLRQWYVDELTHFKPTERHMKLDEDKKYDSADLDAIVAKRLGGEK